MELNSERSRFKVKGYTKSKYFRKVRSALRMAFRYWPPMYEALKNATVKGEGGKKHYLCKNCKKAFTRKEVQIHHKIPCGSIKDFNEVVPFLKRLTNPSPDSYEILCKNCHKKETEKTSKKRKQI